MPSRCQVYLHLQQVAIPSVMETRQLFRTIAAPQLPPNVILKTDMHKKAVIHFYKILVSQSENPWKETLSLVQMISEVKF